MAEQEKTWLPQEIGFRVAIDLFTVVAIVFGGGIVYQQIDHQGKAIEALAKQVEALQNRPAPAPDSTARLARIEALLEVQQRDIAEIKREVKDGQRR